MGVCAAVLLTGCSVTVQPKHPVAAATVSQPPTTAAPSTTPTSTPSKPAAKDVDHTTCEAVRAILLTAQTKVGGADKSSPRRMGADFKAAGTAIRGEAQKTKNTDLKSTLTQMATDYETLGTNVAAGRSKATTDADLKKISDIGPHLDDLCPEKS
jgi:hypothetical protein